MTTTSPPPGIMSVAAMACASSTSFPPRSKQSCLAISPISAFAAATIFSAKARAVSELSGLRAYLVGGAVRDKRLGLPVHERDWVVIGVEPAEMERRGFKPVGKDFPVYLHPHTKEEYALARTERKTGPGYQGFAVYA